MTEIIIREYGKGQMRASGIRNLLKKRLPKRYEVVVIEE
jgi:hypothetical protein